MTNLNLVGVEEKVEVMSRRRHLTAENGFSSERDQKMASSSAPRAEVGGETTNNYNDDLNEKGFARAAAQFLKII